MTKIIAVIAGLVFATAAVAQAKKTILIPYDGYMISVPSSPGIYANTFAGSDLAEKIKAAISSLPHSSGIVKIASGNYPITTGSIVIPSNVTVVCDPGLSTVIEIGTSTFNIPLVSITNATNFSLENCVIDGNRSANTNSFSLIQVAGSSYGTFSGNAIRNSYGNGLYLPDGNTQISITDNEFYKNGPPLPNIGVAINSGLSGGSANTFIRIDRNKIHDNNIGIEIQPSLTSTSSTTNFDISNNEIYSNANDGLVVLSAGMSFGLISNFTIANNQSYCNGWPTDGVRFSSNCRPGILQTGSVASSSGVGIDLNSPLFQQSSVGGNTAHDNYYEGIDVTLQTTTVVNTNGTTVDAVSGDPFNTSWKLNQGVNINNVLYLISSISSTKRMTLKTSAGTQSGVPFVGAGIGQNTMTGNTSYNNGAGNLGASGHGFGDISYGGIWVNNVAYNNNGAGFIDRISSYVTHTGDTAYNNDLTVDLQGGFVCQSCLNSMYTNITAYDSTIAGRQAYGLVLDSQTNNVQATCINLPEGGLPSWTWEQTTCMRHAVSLW